LEHDTAKQKMSAPDEPNNNGNQHHHRLVMPAEWKHHHACLILFPHNPCTFRLEPAKREVLQVARAIATQGQETVWLLAKDEAEAQAVRSLTSKDDNNGNDTNIQVAVCPSEDTWIRDTGPTCCWNLQTGKVVGVDWGFNAYGGPEEGCYWPCEADKGIAKRECELLEIEHHDATKSLILEGGSIHTDGEGTLLATEECLLNPNRNPQLSQSEIEGIIKQTLGVQTILWLPKGLDADEDTNGHVDNFCCFVKPGHVVLAWTDDEKNDPENYARCREAETILLSSKDAKGRNLQVHRLQLPPPMVSNQ
jgi:agmatine deiminase